jgi:Bacterial pre-peptidase C-terminal domain
MSRFRFCALVVFAAAPALAQQPQPGLPQPRLDTVFPMGAKAGTTVPDLGLTGTNLDDADALIFSHPGIKAELVPPPVEPEPKADPKDPKKNPPPPKKKGGTPSPNKFKVTVGADVSPGNYDVRAVGKEGASNPRVFVVGDLPEVAEKEPNNDAPEAMKIALNTTVNGTIASPTDVDLFLVPAKKGQRVVAACIADSIDSRAQPLVEIYDSSYRRLAGVNGPDAVTDFVAQADGDYFVRVAQFTYTAGGPQYFYRLTVTTNPWIDAIFPPVVEPGKPAQVTLYGRNLPGGTPEPGTFVDGRPLEKLAVTINPPTEATRLLFHGHIEPRAGGVDGFEYRLKSSGGVSNPVLIGFAQDKVVFEKEPNDKPEEAMELPIPCEVAGRIDKRGDRDWYAFTAKKGEAVVIDLWADRLGTSTDFLFSVRQATAKTDMIEKDDNPEILSNSQFHARTTDPDPYVFTAPADGKYLIQVSSREANYLYGPKTTYRLRVGPPRLDFRVVAMAANRNSPDSTVLRVDGSQYIEVYAFRYDGFTGPITLTAEGLPVGVTCTPQSIGPAQRAGSMVLTAAPNAAKFDGPITIKATAAVAGKPLTREARSASVTWGVQPGQNIPTITRLDSGLMISVRPNALFKVTTEPENAFITKAGDKLPQPLTIKQGEKLTVPFKVARISPDAKVAITLRQVTTTQNPAQMPVLVNNGQPLAPIAPDKTDGTFVIEAKTIAPAGTYTVVLQATAQIQYEAQAGKGKKPAQVEQAVTPVTINIVPVSLAKVTATPTGNLKGGMSSDLVVKVERQNEFAGEFKVKVVLPMNAKGVTADEVTIPAGQNEVKLPLKATADVAAGQLAGVSVTVTGMYDGKVAITTESPKFNVTVEKAPAPKKEEPKKEEPKKKDEPKKK